MRNNIASFEKTSSSEVKFWAKFNAKINSALGDSHVAGKKYWIISQVVEVITSKSNEIYHEWPEATSDKFHYFYK